MPRMTAYAPGSFSWIELASTNPIGAKAFYGRLLGWTSVDNTSDHGVYTLLQKEGQDVAGLYQSPHGGSAWTPYFTVADADAAAGRARTLGGEVVMEPLEVMDHGRMAVLRDPAGAGFAVWQARTHIGSRFFGDTGSPCWAELMSTDPGRVKPFYASLFGWTVDDESMKAVPYTIFQRDGVGTAGLMEIRPEWRAGGSLWIVYLAVDDCDRAVATAQGLGGRMAMEPMDIQAVGRFAYLEDASGARFAVLKPQPMGQA